MDSTVPLWVALVPPAATIFVTALTLWFTNRREPRLKERELEAAHIALRPPKICTIARGV